VLLIDEPFWHLEGCHHVQVKTPAVCWWLEHLASAIALPISHHHPFSNHCLREKSCVWHGELQSNTTLCDACPSVDLLLTVSVLTWYSKRVDTEGLDFFSPCCGDRFCCVSVDHSSNVQGKWFAAKANCFEGIAV
jgi:hypothetical protein